MPSKLKAGGTFPFTLEADRNDDKPQFFGVRVLSAFEDAEVSEIRQQFLAVKGGRERVALIQSAVNICVADAPHPLVVEQLTQTLTSLECWALINAATEGANLTNEERKKFVLPLQSEMDFSAGDAVASA
jgi:hypothetical protein